MKGIGGNSGCNRSHTTTSDTTRTHHHKNTTTIDGGTTNHHKYRRRTMTNTTSNNENSSTNRHCDDATSRQGTNSKKGTFSLNKASSFFSSSNNHHSSKNMKHISSNNNNLHMYDETSSTGGIEVSLSHDTQHHPPLHCTASGTVPSPRTQNELLGVLVSDPNGRNKIYRAQFNPIVTTNYNTNNQSSPLSSSSPVVHANTTKNASTTTTIRVSPQKSILMRTNFQSRDHRIPLFTTDNNNNNTNTISDDDNNNELLPKRTNSIRTLEDAVHLLRSYNVVDELSCVHEEIHNMNQEIIEINYDLHDIVSILQEQQQHDSEVLPHHAGTSDDIDNNGTQKNSCRIWDIHAQLLVRSSQSQQQHLQTVTPEQRSALQHERGCNFTIYLHNYNNNHRHNTTTTTNNNNNTNVMESLLSKCGSRHSVHTSQGILGTTNSFLNHIISLGGTSSQSQPNSDIGRRNGNLNSNHHNNRGDNNNNNDVIHITTQTCREGGAGTTIQHLSLFHRDIDDANATTQQHVSKNNAAITGFSSFILSHDNGLTYHHGSLPQQLQRRMVQEQMKKNNMKTANKSTTYYMDNIIYLATGPYGTYYVEFRNSEKWWGIITNNHDNHNKNNNKIEADHEEEFNTICYDWDVHRVAFGPCTIQQRSTVPSISLSWIIISKDGKVAWKNIPLRLHNYLSNRIASDSTPCEVSLGANGSYYIRFIDGTSDWSLPAKTAQECQNLILRGATIRSISLHPDLSNDFIIRHSISAF